MAGWRKQVVCVLNKADLLLPAELDRVVEYVRSNANRVIRAAGSGPPVKVLPVSARAALALKMRLVGESNQGITAGRGAPDLGAKLQVVSSDSTENTAALQWEAFEAQIRQVLQDGARLKMLSQLATAWRLLEVYSRIEEQSTSLARADADAVDEAKQRIAEFERSTRNDFDAQVARAQLVLAQLGQRGHRFLQEELTLSQLPRLLSRERFLARFEKVVVADATTQLERVALALADWMDGRSSTQTRDTLFLLQARIQRPSEVLSRDGSAGVVHANGGARAPGGQVAPDPVSQVAASSYVSRRQDLLLSMQRSARESMASSSVVDAGERAMAAIQTSLAQVLVLEISAAGLTGMVLSLIHI